MDFLSTIEPSLADTERLALTIIRDGGALGSPGMTDEESLYRSHDGFFFGLGGVIYLMAVREKRGHKIYRAALDAHVKAMEGGCPAMDGAWHGIAGGFLLGWGLHAVNALEGWHRDLLRNLLDRLEGLSETQASIFDLPAYARIDLALGLAGNLLAVARASEFMPSDQRRLAKLKQAIEERLFKSLSLLAGTPFGADATVVGGGFAHGLAGIALAVAQAGRIFGPHPRATELFLAVRRSVQEPANRNLPFCWHRDGGVAVLRHVMEEDDGWPEVRSLPSSSVCDACCGIAGYHLARLASLRDLRSYATLPPRYGIGYMHSSGNRLIWMAERHVVHDPLWGRVIL